MPWHSLNTTLKRRMNQHGLGTILDATKLCQKAESLHPGMFRAISIKDNVLHIEISKQNQLQFTFIQGKLLQELNAHAKAANLPLIERVRLTFATE